MTMTKTIRLTLDQDLTAKLEELADYHGESEEDTIRLVIRDAHAYLQRFIEEEIGQNGEKIPPQQAQPDDEIPI
jgi:predicted transcriptional regulator